MEVLVLGGGYAGVALTRQLERILPDDISLSLIDESGEHLLQHELHRVIRFPSIREHLRIPLEEVLDRADIVEATVSDIDLEDRVVHSTTGRTFEPEYLAVCLGGVTVDTGFATDAQPLKRLAHADAIRERYASLPPDGRVLIGGAGLSGIQVAGELAAMESGGGVAREILLIEQAETIAPRFPRAFRKAIRSALADAGVSVRTGERISGIAPGSVELATGSMLSADQVIWTGGLDGSSAMGGRRPDVRADLRVADGVYVLGDAARVIDARGDVVPPSAQTAVRQATIAARNVRSDVRAARGETPRATSAVARYRYNPRGWVVSVGDATVATVGGLVIRGQPALALKVAIGAGYLSSIGRIQRSIQLVADEVRVATANA